MKTSARNNLVIASVASIASSLSATRNAINIAGAVTVLDGAEMAIISCASEDKGSICIARVHIERLGPTEIGAVRNRSRECRHGS